MISLVPQIALFLSSLGTSETGGASKYIDIVGLKEEINGMWDINKHIVKHIAKVQKAVNTLSDQTKIKLTKKGN